MCSFEFRTLEVALGTACSFLDSQATELVIEAYPLLDEIKSSFMSIFMSNFMTSNGGQLRLLNDRLVALTQRVQKVKDEIAQLLADDGNKKRELELLLEANIVLIDRILNKLNSLKECINENKVELEKRQNELSEESLIPENVIAGVITYLILTFRVIMFNTPYQVWVVLGGIIFSVLLAFHKAGRLNLEDSCRYRRMQLIKKLVTETQVVHLRKTSAADEEEFLVVN